MTWCNQTIKNWSKASADKPDHQGATEHGGGAVQIWNNSPDKPHTNAIFENCSFYGNGLTSSFDNNYATGAAVNIGYGVELKFMNTRFEYNYIDVRDGSNSGGDGVILRTAHGEPNSWDNVPDIVFNRCYFKNNRLVSTHYGTTCS